MRRGDRTSTHSLSRKRTAPFFMQLMQPLVQPVHLEQPLLPPATHSTGTAPWRRRRRRRRAAAPINGITFEIFCCSGHRVFGSSTQLSTTFVVLGACPCPYRDHHTEHLRCEEPGSGTGHHSTGCKRVAALAAFVCAIVFPATIKFCTASFVNALRGSWYGLRLHQIA